MRESFALIFQPFRPETRAAAERCQELLAQWGIFAELLAASDLPRRSPLGFVLALTFGGDGTALRAAAWLVGTGIPIVPIKMGKLSFLAELSPEDLPRALAPLVERQYRLDERVMLRACHGTTEVVGLNDVVVGRGAASRAVRLDVFVDRALLARYTSDGIVVSTPTGSTAYALAAGGPVLAPSLRAMLLVPIAPHLTQLRALVVPGEARIEIVVHTVQPAILTVDGHLDLPVADGERVCIELAAETTRFARLGTEADFYRLLEARLTRRE